MEEKARHLNFNKFVEDRSVQIAKFITDLELDTKKKGHQALQKSVRRRAMSHNRFRIPKKLRKTMEQDLAKAERMQKLPKCRKHIRKRRHLITAYKMRSDKVQWLSTHLWAARRMRMVSYYGFKIAHTPNNKSFRSSYRHTQHGCVLSDLSYYLVVTLHAKTKEASLPHFIRIIEKTFPESGKIYSASIVDNSGILICPCYLIRPATVQLSLRIFFHPAATTEIKKLGAPSDWTASMQQGQYDIYCLNGPHSLKIAEQALHQYGLLQEQQNLSSKFYGRNGSVVYLSGLSNNFSFSNKPLIDAPIPQQKRLSQGYESSSNISIRNKMVQLFNSLNSNQRQNKNQKELFFWKIFDQGQNKGVEKILFKITLRSKYTHRRKNKMTKEEKKVAARQERESSTERGNNKIKDSSQSSYQHKQIFVEEPIKQKTVLEEVHPILVAHINSNSILLFANNADSCRFWRILSKLNLKVVGRKQTNHYNLEQSIRTFPQDYPQTAAFKEYRQETLNFNFTKYKKFPIQKRPNFLKLRSPYPFAPFLPQKPTPVELQVVSRGHCQKLSYICQLLSSDLQNINKQLQSGHIGVILSEEGEGDRKKYGNLKEIQMDLSLIVPSRKIIGVVTSGCYRYSRSREGGIGFIDKAKMSQGYFQKFDKYILIRKPNSPNYILGTIRQQLQ